MKPLKPRILPSVEVNVRSYLAPEIENLTNNVTLKTATGRWKLVDIEPFENKPAYQIMYIEVNYIEHVETKRTWKDRFQEDFWDDIEIEDITKTVWLQENWFEINQTYDFDPNKKDILVNTESTNE